jgi:hypothetical protein
MTIRCEDDPDFVSPRSTPISTTLLNASPVVIPYEQGTAPTGLDLVFAVTANHSNFTISGHNTLWYEGDTPLDNDFTVTYNFLIGDIIAISTHPKKKKLTRTRASVDLDLAGYLNQGAVWPRLYSGVNVFTWDIATSWMSWTSASYVPRYWGV